MTNIETIQSAKRNIDRWKSLAYCITLWVINLLLLFLVGQFLVKRFPPSWERFIYGIPGTMAALIATGIVLKIEGISWTHMQLLPNFQSIKKFIKGLGIGSLFFGIILLALVLFTKLEFVYQPADFRFRDAVFYLSIFPLALMEEIAFRGYPLVKLQQAFGNRSALWITTIAFALYHIITGWTISAALLGPGVWGLLFGLAAQQSKGIALPTGIHLALNLLQPIFGTKGSDYHSIWVMNLSSAATASETNRVNLVGMVIQIFFLILAIVLIEYYTRRKSTNNHH